MRMNSGGISSAKKTSSNTCASPRTSIDGKRCRDRKSTRLNSSHSQISYAVFCLKKKINDCPKSQDCPLRPQQASFPFIGAVPSSDVFSARQFYGGSRPDISLLYARSLLRRWPPL